MHLAAALELILTFELSIGSIMKYHVTIKTYSFENSFREGFRDVLGDFCTSD